MCLISYFFLKTWLEHERVKNWKREKEDDFLKENFGVHFPFHLKVEDFYKTEVWNFIRFIPLNTYITNFKKIAALSKQIIIQLSFHWIISSEWSPTLRRRHEGVIEPSSGLLVIINFSAPWKEWGEKAWCSLTLRIALQWIPSEKILYAFIKYVLNS